MTETMNTFARVLADGASLPTHGVWYRGEGGATYSHHSDFAFMWIFYISVFWFLLVMGLMVYFVLKYRRKEGQAAEPSPHHHTRLEVAWTVIPTLFLVWMFVEGFRGYKDMLVPMGGGIQVDLEARKWEWTIKYPNGAESREKTGESTFLATRRTVFYFPEKTPVQLRMISADVMHSFWVPDFRAKIDVLPNRYTKYWFQSEPIAESSQKRRLPALESGLSKDYDCVDHWLFCAEYCGEQHSEMGGIIRIVPQEAYDEWLEKNGVGGLPLVDLGKFRYNSLCIACHTTNGKQGTGPTWKDLYGKTETFTDGTTGLVDDDYIRESILTPAKKIVAGYPNQMTPFALSDRDISGIIEYMKTLSSLAPPAGGGAEAGAGGGGGGGGGAGGENKK